MQIETLKIDFLFNFGSRLFSGLFLKIDFMFDFGSRLDYFVSLCESLCVLVRYVCLYKICVCVFSVNSV